MTLDQVFRMHAEGSIATRQAAQEILKNVTEENKDTVLDRLLTDQYLHRAVDEVVNDFKNLTDHQWDGIVTCEPGAYIRPFTPEEELAHNQRHKEEHRNLRRGVNLLK